MLGQRRKWRHISVRDEYDSNVWSEIKDWRHISVRDKYDSYAWSEMKMAS
jgi:hypothetical protein